MTLVPYQKVFIGLGSNLGDRADNIQRALVWMAAQPEIEVVLTSALKETPPWGMTDQPPFMNAAAVVHTHLSPHALLTLLKCGEAVLGRTAGGLRWGPRVIDLDILLYGADIVNTETLVVPHPRLTERDFVMEQILELDTAAFHPERGCTVLSLLTERE